MGEVMEHEFCAVYLSGTGNTKFCVSRLLKLLDEGAPCVAIEDMVASSTVAAHEKIVLGYPVQYSNAPKLVRDFILQNMELWRGKRVLCLATMGAFSGDGAGCAARLLKKCGAKILGGLHLKMPDSVCDSKLLEKSGEEKRDLIRRAEEKIGHVAEGIKGGKYPRDGLGFFAHIAGLFGQRLWFYGKTRKYCDKLKIDGARCVGCGVCARLCPMKNLTVEGGVAVPHGKCTMCYRCISRCPQRAITLVGKEVVEQYRAEEFVGE